MENKVRFRSLARTSDFAKLRAGGQSFHINSWLLVNVQKTTTGEFRLGWTISRQVGSAVIRNRLRRWGREYMRLWAADSTRSMDMNLILKRKEKDFYKQLSHVEFDRALAKTMGRAEQVTQ